MAHAMWSGGSGSGGRFDGRHVTATHLINSPQSISGRASRSSSVAAGSGRRCGWWPSTPTRATSSVAHPDVVRAKLAVLREHCERLGRPYEEIERTVLTSVDPDGEAPAAIVERFGELAEAGAQHVIFSVRGVADTSRLERIASEVSLSCARRPAEGRRPGCCRPARAVDLAAGRREPSGRRGRVRARRRGAGDRSETPRIRSSVCSPSGPLATMRRAA